MLPKSPRHQEGSANLWQLPAAFSAAAKTFFILQGPKYLIPAPGDRAWGGAVASQPPLSISGAESAAASLQLLLLLYFNFVFFFFIFFSSSAFCSAAR